MRTSLLAPALLAASSNARFAMYADEYVLAQNLILYTTDALIGGTLLVQPTQQTVLA